MMSIKELCIELGISAPYIEDEISFLVQNQLMREVGGKYQTDFVILPGQNIKMADKIFDACFPAYYNDLIELLESNKEVLSKSTAGFEWNRLLWMYIHLLTDINLCKFKRDICKIVMYCDIPDRPNGGKWIALGFENNFPSIPVQTDFKDYQPYDGPVHKGGEDAVQGFFHYWSGLDSTVFFDIPAGVFALCKQIIKSEVKINDLDDEQKFLFSIAVEKNLFVKTETGFVQNYCFIPSEQMQIIQKIADKFYGKAKTYFKKAYDVVFVEYEKEVPKHLRWQMGNFLSNHLNVFVTCSLYMAKQNGLLSTPKDRDKSWLSLFATE